jgi:hypothetical protein
MAAVEDSINHTVVFVRSLHTHRDIRFIYKSVTPSYIHGSLINKYRHRYSKVKNNFNTMLIFF